MRSYGDRYIDDGWAQVGVQDALCGMKARALRDVPEAAVISEHAGELCEQGRAVSTFQGLYVIYLNNNSPVGDRVGLPKSRATWFGSDDP